MGISCFETSCPKIQKALNLQKSVAEKERYLREEKEAIEREARLLKGEVDPVKDKGVVEIAFGNEQYRCLRQPTRR